MANVIEACLRRIYHSIPSQILELAFRPEKHETLDHAIHEKVIHDRVLFDSNLVGGRAKQIVLNKSWVEVAETPAPFIFGNSQTYCIYRIPPEARENRMLSSVIELRYPYTIHDGLQMPNSGMGTNMGGNTVGGLACQALEGQTWANAVPLPTPILVSGHQVKLIPSSVSQIQDIDWILTCRLNYDAEFMNLNNQAILPLVELVLCAVKAYIYNELALKIDTAYIVGGQAMGKLKEIVESYSDQNDRYLELLREFNGGAVVLDGELRRRRIRDML